MRTGADLSRLTRSFFLLLSLAIPLLSAVGCADGEADDDDSSSIASPTPPLNQGAPNLELGAVQLTFDEAMAGGYQDESLTVGNSGTADLVVKASISDSSGSLFTLTSSSEPVTVAPGASATVTVRFSPLTGGDYKGSLQLDTNDESNAVVHIPLEARTALADSDGDGYPGGGTDPEDCDDTDASVYPGASEVCDELDNDCDGQVDEAVKGTWYQDGDSDGYGVTDMSLEACEAPAGYADKPGDCEDNDAAFHPNATESCTDSVDYNCDGSVAYADNDGDGVPACQECDDGDASVYPGAAELCDGKDNDCNGQIDEEVTSIYYADSDGDGFGDAASPTTACTAPAGYVTDDLDCADADPVVYPGADELCDGRDNDCNGASDESSSPFAPTWYVDNDGDGYGTGASTVVSCPQPTGYAALSGDCNDADAAWHPGAAESCTADQDYNCDGSTSYADADSDGTPACQDCDDKNPAAYPGGLEVCDGADNDCNGQSDEGVKSTWYADKDNDGFGSASTSVQACTAPAGYLPDPGTPALFDCNDADASVNPQATETCNGKDDNCDGQIDESNAQGCQVVYADGDGDSWGGSSSACVCSIKLGQVTRTGDCDDKNTAVNPGVLEKCNSIDDNCDGTVDEVNAQGCSRLYADQDDDAYGVTGDYQCLCQAQDNYSATVGGDCLDTDKTVYPGGLEVCDGKDNNCNGQLDEGVKNTYYIDSDGDGYGASYNSKEACSAPTGYVAQGGDCNDYNASIHPNAAELCDTLDNNCNGQADEALAQSTVYVDLDGDGHGASGITGKSSCLIDTNADGKGDTAPTGYSLVNDDCNDSDATVYTGANDVCDSKDNDCDGVVDKLCFSQCSGNWPFKLDYNLSAPISKPADLNGDGEYEVIVQDNFGFAILDSAGNPLYNYSAPIHNYSRNLAVLADIDTYDTYGADTQGMEVLTGNGSYPLFYKLNSNKTISTYTNPTYIYDASRFIASDVDFDGKPEFFTNSWCDPKAAVEVFRFDKSTGTINLVKQIPDPEAQCEYTDGRTLTDLDGDGLPEFVFGNGYAYATNPSVWGGHAFALKFTDFTAVNTDYFCPSGQCFNTNIAGLYGGGVGDLFRVGDTLHTSVTYFTNNIPNDANPSTNRYWYFSTAGAALSGSPSTSAGAWYPTDLDDDGVEESYSQMVDLGLWDVNGDGYPDQLYVSGNELRLNLWNAAGKKYVENTASRLSVSSANLALYGAWDTNADGQINVTASDTNGVVYCYQLGKNTWNKASSLPPHMPWYQRTYQWDNYEPNEGTDTNADGLPDRVVRVASALTKKGNFYSYISSATDVDYYQVDAGYNGQICLTSPKKRAYKLKVYSFADLWNNSSHAAGADGKKDGLIWTGTTSAGGTTCFAASLVTPYRNGEYKFVIGIESSSGYSPYWPYWISAPK